MKCQGVHDQGVAAEVQQLAAVADTVGSADPERVLERPVDRLGVVAAPEQRGEPRLVGRERPDVLGAVEAPGRIRLVAVEPRRDWNRRYRRVTRSLVKAGKFERVDPRRTEGWLSW